MQQGGGIIIRRRKLTESSLIVTWLTEECGVVRTVAKGALRPKNRFEGKLDLFVEAEIHWVLSRTSQLHTLTEVSVRNYHSGWRGDYPRTLVASYFCELVERALEEETAVPEILDLLRRAFGFLGDEGEIARAVPFFEKTLAETLGLGSERGFLGRLEDALQGGFPASRAQVQSYIKKR